MQVGEGMVAVVRGLRDAGLAVTLLDSGRQYTLIPDGGSRQVNSGARVNRTTASQCISDAGAQRENAVQATDGRYASTYRTMHCHVTPTSPPYLATEFPPQRPDVSPGHGNFEIGGMGSGENFSYPVKCNGFRGGLNWPDRGSVFAARPSVQPDSFASSLRKYPGLTQERSSEIVERLITFSQAKNSSKTHRNNSSPHRNLHSDVSSPTASLDGNSSRNHASRSPQRNCDPEVIVTPKRQEESPTRDRPRKGPVDDSWRRPAFCKTNDMRCLKVLARKNKEGDRYWSANANSPPERLISRDSSGTNQHTRAKSLTSNSVNMEIQAAVPMVSREVVTVPRKIPSQRTISIPLTQTISQDIKSKNDGASTYLDLSHVDHAKSATVDITVQTMTSSVELRDKKSNTRKRSRSIEAVRITEKIKNEILGILQEFPSEPCCSKRKTRKPHRLNKSKRISDKSFENNVNLKHKCKYVNCEFSKGRAMCEDKRSAKLYHTIITSGITADDEILVEILEEWLDLIPFRTQNYIKKLVEKEVVFYELFDFLKYAASDLTKINEDNLKLNIVEKLEVAPLEPVCNKKIVINNLADILINKLKHRSRKRWNKRIRKNILRDEFEGHSSNKKIVPITEDDVRNFISREITSLSLKSHIKINQYLIPEMEDELSDILMASLKTIERGSDNHIRKGITQLLHDYYEFPKHEALFFTNNLIQHLKDDFIKDSGPIKIKSESFIVLPSLQSIANPHKTFEKKNNIVSISDKEILNNLETYTNKLCKEIDEWLSSLNIDLLQSQERGFKQIVVNDLAGDIADRQKYLELNPASKVSDQAELENLKYQIFKWINKLVGEDNLIPMEHAPDLMKRIQKIPIPVLSKQYGTISLSSSVVQQNQEIQRTDNSPISHVNIYVNAQNKRDEYVREQNINKNVMNAKNFSQANTSTSNSFAQPGIRNTMKNLGTCCRINNNASQNPKTNEQLEEEYEYFIKNWVQRIPIQIPEDESLVEKARLGIYNGLWKVISKLNCDPASYYNRFLYEDLLDDAIDDLLDCLPETSELRTRRYLLKVELIEKTIAINEQIKLNDETSLKNKLMKNLTTNLRKQGITTNFNDPIKVQEEIQIMKLVEDYLLAVRYQDEDKIKSEVYKKKLLKVVEDFIDQLKRHNPLLNEVDVATYKASIINELQKVPIPSEASIKNEADDIILGLEIEQWYSDLPIVSNSDIMEQYRRRKQREMLVKKVKDLERTMSEDETALKNEVSRFLDKAPLQDGESLNINIMVDELVNRIKNRRQEANQNVKKVVFEESSNYKGFSEGIPHCSSLIGAPTHSQYQENTTQNAGAVSHCSNMCHGKQSVPNPTFEHIRSENMSINFPSNRNGRLIQEPPNYKVFEEERPCSSSFKEDSNKNWQTLFNEDTFTPTVQKFDGRMHNIPQYTTPNTFNQKGLVNQNQPNIQTTEQKTPTGPAYKEVSIQKWYTLHDSQSLANAPKDDLGMHTLPPYTSLPRSNTHDNFPSNQNYLVMQRPYNATASEQDKPRRAYLKVTPNQKWYTLHESQLPTNQNRSAIQEPANYSTFQEERPVSSSLKEDSNKTWLTLHDTQPVTNAQRRDLSMHVLPPHTNRHMPNISLHEEPGRLSLEKSNVEVIPSPYHEQSSHTDDPRGIKTSRGILGISQIPGPSGINQSYPDRFSTPSYSYAPQGYQSIQYPNRHEISINSNTKNNGTIEESLLDKEVTIPDERNSTMGCYSKNLTQYDQMTKEYEMSMNLDDQQLNAGTNTPFDGTSDSVGPVYASTPNQNVSPSIPSVPGKKRFRLAVSDKDAVRRRLNLDDSEEDDHRCYCIERHWKIKPKTKHFCEEFEDHPPYVPILLPYPYFL